jgi:CheY-like chemotaxis protein
MRAPRILLVEDQREVSRMLRTSLELSGRGYIVIDVPSAEDALFELGRGPVDLLVTDVVLPGISGIDLITKTRQLNPDAQVIVITGHQSQEIKDRAEALGVFAFITKPIVTSYFLEAVEHSLATREYPIALVKIQEERIPLMEKCLEEIRLELGAEATLLLDERGKIVVQTGDIGGLDFEGSLPTIMAAFSAGLKTSNLLGSLLPGNIQYFDGDAHDLYLTNVGAFFALLIIIRSDQEYVKMGAVVHYGRKAAGELVDILSSSTTEGKAEVGSGAGQIVWEVRQLSSETDEIMAAADFKDVAQQEVAREAAEQYWDEAEAASSSKEDHDKLTFSEAEDMGLLAEDEDEESKSNG